MNAIFITGTGRSGTHFLCRTLLGFTGADDFLAGREDKRRLRAVAEAAIQQRPLPPEVTAGYERLIEKATARHRVFVDQHHPNLYHLRQLARLFPAALFLYPDRPTAQVVASMLNHEGVRNWYQRIEAGFEVPFPSAFFGLESRRQIASLPLSLLCARRVLAHRSRARRAEREWPERMRRVDFTALVRDPVAELARIFTAAERESLGLYVEKERPDPATLSKYHSVLSAAEIAAIEALEAAWP